VSQRVFLHPGPLKTGTTYLQSLLYANRESFLSQGVTIVGTQASHYRAAKELMRRRPHRKTQGAWSRTRAAVLRAQGDVVMSCERYSLLRVEHAQRVLEDLDGREVHAVLTLRDVVSVLPARWQEGIKNGGTASWAEFQDRIVQDPARLRKITRAVSTLEVWAAVLPADRIHVVTVPPSSAPRTLLFERFCEAVGADPTKLQTLEPTRVNRSMDLVTTELVRRVNLQRAVKLSGAAQQSEIKAFLAQELAKRSRVRPELGAAVLEAAKGETEALVRQIETGGFHVVGDLNDLTSTTSSAPTGGGTEVDPEQLLDAAAVAVAALARRSWSRGQRLKRLETRRRFRTARRAWRRLLR
jgi:hypothetical protein